MSITSLATLLESLGYSATDALRLAASQSSEDSRRTIRQSLATINPDDLAWSSLFNGDEQ